MAMYLSSRRYPLFFELIKTAKQFTLTALNRNSSKMLFSHRRMPSQASTLAGPPGPGGRGQLPMLQLPDRMRWNLLCVGGEFVGTFLFLFFSFAGTQVSNTPMPPPGSPPNTSNLLYSALSFGFALTVNVWAFFRVTGGLFNPAVSPSISPSFSTNLYWSSGHARPVPNRRNARPPRRDGLSRPAGGRHRLRRCRERPLPRSVELQHPPRRRDFHFSRPFHRDVPHGSADPGHYHAGCRQTQVNIPCAGGHWIDVLRYRTYW